MSIKEKTVPLSSSQRRHSRLIFAVLAAAVQFYTTEGSAQRLDHGPFSGLSGQWSGYGSLTKTDGAKERIQCRARYAAGGTGASLSMQLNCASTSYKMQISAHAVSNGGALSGSWNEAVHGQVGNISGSAAGATIRAQVSGGSFSAGVGIRTQGNSQSVTITPSAGTDVRYVTISMHK
jgi:hypothetical protein